MATLRQSWLDRGLLFDAPRMTENCFSTTIMDCDFLSVAAASQALSLVLLALGQTREVQTCRELFARLASSLVPVCVRDCGSAQRHPAARRDDPLPFGIKTAAPFVSFCELESPALESRRSGAGCGHAAYSSLPPGFGIKAVAAAKPRPVASFEPARDGTRAGDVKGLRNSARPLPKRAGTRCGESAALFGLC